MPAKHTLHVALTEQLVAYVRRMVADGHHSNASQVIRAGLQHMIEQDERARHAGVSTTTTTRG